MKRANLLLSWLSFCLLALEATGSDNGPSVALTRRAIELGMEPAALGELWRTKQPVIISRPDALGQLYTTTYHLTPDGKDIHRSTVKEEHLPPPQNDNVVPTTSTTSRTTSTTPPSLPAVQPTNPQTEWEYVPSPGGNRRTFTPFFGGSFPQLNHNWPSFGFPAGVTPQTTTKTEQDDQGRTVTTTTKSYKGPLIGGSWSLGTDVSTNWPSFSFPAGVQPHRQPETNNIFAPSLPPWFNNPQFFGMVPSLTPSLRPSATQPEPAPLPQPVPVPVPVPPPFFTRPTVVSMPPLPTAATTPLPPLDDSRKHTIATNNVDALPTGTEVTSYNVNFNCAAPPKISDLEPQAREMVYRAGINDEDLRNAWGQGNVVSRTHTTPDGKVIRTVVRLKSSPSPEAAPPPAAVRPTHDNAIDGFLSQVNLTPEDLQAQNGEVIKTIVDQNGRVLNVRFVLSTVKGTDEQGLGQGQATRPTK